MKKIFVSFVVFVCGLNLMAQDTVFLSLQECRERALMFNQDITKQKNASKQMELTRKATLTNFFPQVEGTAMGVYMGDMHMMDNAFMSVDMVMQGAYMAGFTLTQPIYAGGKIVNGYRLTKIGKEVAQEQVRKTKSEIIAQIDNTYWTFVATLNKEQLLQEYANQLDTLIEQLTASVEVGMTTEYDLMRVRVSRSNIEYQHNRTKNGVQMCRLSLCQQIGLLEDTAFIMPESQMPPYNDDYKQQVDLSNRPEMRLLDYQLRAQQLQVKMTVGDYLPTIGLMAGYTWYGNMKLKANIDPDMNQYGQTLQQLGTASEQLGMQLPLTFPQQTTSSMDDKLPMVMLSLSVPLTKWSEGAFKVKKAKLEAENTQLEVQKNKELMQLEVQQARCNVEDSKKLVSSAQIALEMATENLRIMREKYAVKMISLSDLLDAQNQWHQAESDYIEARTQQLIYHTEYLRVTGQLE